MASTRFSEVDWEERDAQAASTHLHIKSTANRIKSASQRRPAREVSYSHQVMSPDDDPTRPRYVESFATDNNFTSSERNRLSA